MATPSSSNSIDEGSQQYPYPYHVNVANFVSIKLSDKSNYRPWQKQMLNLLVSHDMLGFIDGTFEKPQSDNSEWKRSDGLVQGWIFGSLSENVMGTIVNTYTAVEAWRLLKEKYYEPDGYQLYPYPSHVDVASFVSIVLDSSSNYVPWRKQMLKLIASHEMLGFINGAHENQVRDYWWRRSDALVREWILDSVSASVLETVDKTSTAFEVWNTLQEKFYAPVSDKLISDIRLLKEKLNELSEESQVDALRHAIVHGNTVAVKMLVKHNPTLLRLPINDDHEFPIVAAAVYSKRDIYNCLFEYSTFHHLDELLRNPKLLNYTIMAGFFDEAYKLIMDYPGSAERAVRYISGDTLLFLARKWDAFRSAKGHNFYQRLVYSYLPAEILHFNESRMNRDIENQQSTEANPVTRKSYFPQG